MIKKSFIIFFSLFLISCNTIDGSTKEKERAPLTQEEEDEIFINELKEKLEKETMKGLHKLIKDNIDDLNNEESKEIVLEIYNEFVQDYIKEDSNSNPVMNTRFFIDENTKEISNDEYLKEDTAKAIIKQGNKIFTELSNQNLSMELTPEYNDNIKADKGITSTIEWMNDNNVNFNPIGDHEDLSGLIVLNDDTVLEFTHSKIRRIFKIIDSNGDVQDPHTALEELANKFAEEEYKRQKDDFGEPEIVDLDKRPESKKNEEESVEKEKTIVIGMTDYEVLDIKGKPETINRTTTKNGVSEQWVYHRSYLYFEDGILTTIQDER